MGEPNKYQIINPSRYLEKLKRKCFNKTKGVQMYIISIKW